MRVRVGGTWLHGYTRVGDLRLRHAADGGCAEASWTIGRRPSVIASSVLTRGALVEVFHGLSRVWVGVLREPGENGECYAAGLLDATRGIMCLNNLGNPTDDPTDGIAQAVAEGWPVLFLDDTPPNVVPSEKPQRLYDAIASVATANEVRATVHGDGVLRWEADPVAPSLLVLPGVGALARTDEEYATRIRVRYVSSVSGTPPVADAFDHAVAVDSYAETVHGRSDLYIDATDRGLLTSIEAGWIAQGILTKYGARVGFAGGVTVAGRQLRDAGGSRVSLAHVHAGQMVRFLGVRTPLHVNTTAFDVVLGSTDYADGSGEITLNPLGTAPRTLADIIASVPTIHTALNPAPGAGAVQAA